MEPDTEKAHADQVSAWLREGIAAAKAGQNERAHDLLVRVVARDEHNAPAWLWLSGVVEDLEDRHLCLENVLAIDPNNAAARTGLAWVCRRMEQRSEVEKVPAPGQVSPFVVPLEDPPTEVASPPEAAESPVVVRTRTPVTPAGAILREDFISRQADPEPIETLGAIEVDTSQEPVPAPAHARDEFGDQYACPYCATATEPDDDRCRLCGKDLWYRFRKQEKRSSLLWTMLALQLGSAVYLIVPVAFLMFIGSSFIGQMLGIPEIPPLVLYALALPSLFSLALAVGLYFRWKPAYYLLFVDAGLGFILSFLAFVAGVDIFFGLFSAALAGGRLFVIFQLGGDFEWDKQRILLRTDRGLKSGVEYLTRADFYNRHKMWALAVVHMRAALGLVPDRLNCQMALVVAYIRLKRYVLAERALAEARRINPGEPRIAQLEAVVHEMRARQPALP
jgi:predicted nucleic acid-binding Zn ribbon protein